ncbi:MAG: hypothetical protein ACQEV7_07670 [Bacillota bacterium]
MRVAYNKRLDAYYLEDADGSRASDYYCDKEFLSEFLESVKLLAQAGNEEETE